MSARPIRYCAKCGEYVATEESHTYVQQGTGRVITVNVPRLIHIDADGNQIHRAHAPIENEVGR